MTSTRHRLRFALLLGTAISGFPLTDALAQNGTWQGPTNSAYTTAGSWNPAGVPTGTATFASSGAGPIIINSTSIGTIGGWVFTGTDAYIFNDVNGTFNGAGINAGTGPQPTLNATSLTFSGTATLGNAIVNMLGGNISFQGDATGGPGSVNLNNASSVLNFSGLNGANLSIGRLTGVAGSSVSNGDSSKFLTITGTGSLFQGNLNLDAGGLNIAPGASFTTSGSNFYSGGTIIGVGGTLQVGAGGATGNLPVVGGIVNNGTLIFNRSGFSGYGGVISGSGTLQQAGTGTLSLNGVNTFTGPVNITRGTIGVFGNGTLGAGSSVLTMSSGTALDISGLNPGRGLRLGALNGSGTVSLGNQTLTLGAAGVSGNFAGVIQDGGNEGGTGGRLAITAGTTILGGTHTYTGTTTVGAGATLIINGVLTSSQVTVLPGATLGGSGTTGTVTIPADATLTPGNSIGTINLAGLTLAAGSTTVIEVQGSTIDRINVTGNATLGGTLNLRPLGGPYNFNTPYIILQAASVSGNFGAVTTSGDFGAGVTPTVSVNATQVLLGLTPAILVPTPTPTPTPTAPGIPGFLTYNLRATAGALDNANRAGGNLSPFFNVYNQPASTIGVAVNQLSGEVATTTGAMGFASGEQFLATVLDPLGYGRESILGGRLRPTGGDGDGQSATTNRKQYAVWGTATGAYNRTTGDAQDGSASRTTRTAGFVLGFDHLIGSQSMAGIAISAGESSASVASGQGSGLANFGQIGGYGSTRLGSFTLAGAGAFTFMDLDTKRTLYFLNSDQQRAGFNAQVYSLRAELRQDGVTAGGFRFQPIAAIQWQQVNNQGYTESSFATGTTNGVTVTGQSQTSLRTELGAQVQGSAMLGTIPVQGFLRASWAHYLTRDASMGVGFASLPNAGFTVRGAQGDANAALLSAGLEVPIRPGLTLGGRVDSELSGNVTQVAGTARLRYSF